MPTQWRNMISTWLRMTYFCILIGNRRFHPELRFESYWTYPQMDDVQDLFWKFGHGIPNECFILIVQCCARIVAVNLTAYNAEINTWKLPLAINMMTSSNGNIFRVTGPLWGEYTGYQWIPLTKANKFWCLLWSALNKRLSKQSRRR